MARFDPALLPAAPDLSLENALWTAGLTRIGGLDEAGRGALAGPVAAAAIVLPADPALTQALCGVRDSKVMSPRERSHWEPRLQACALSWNVAFASSQEIDDLGILPATRLAMLRAIQGLSPQPDHVLIDHLLLPDLPLPQTALTKGDARSLSIAAASVLAKVARDRLMRSMDAAYPLYGFASHKGYGTRMHRQAIARWGATPQHRQTFAPVRQEPGGE